MPPTPSTELVSSTVNVTSRVRTRPGKPQTILLIGSDRRYVGGTRTDARSDTMMLVRLNPDVHAITVMSVPRDLPVGAAARGRVVTEKLNSAFTRGG